MNISIDSLAKNSETMKKQDTKVQAVGGVQGVTSQNSRNPSNKRRDNFTHDRDISEELKIYDSYKNNPLDMPYEYKHKLETLLKALQEGREHTLDIGMEAYEEREKLIDKIEDLFETQDMLGEKRLQNALMESTKAALETQKDQLEATMEEIKKLMACIEISVKVSSGTASPEEIRFLIKHNPELYAMAVARQIPTDDDKEKKPTVDIDFEEDDDGISAGGGLNELSGNNFTPESATGGEMPTTPPM